MADEIISEPDHIHPDIPEPFEIVYPPSRLGSRLGYGRLPQYIDNPIRAVRSIVSRNDDPDLQSMTVRTWTIGPILCAGMAIVSAKGLFQDKELVVPMVDIQFIILGAAKLMEMLPNKILWVPLIKRELSLNPCEFNYKEHVLISLFAYIGRIRPDMLQTISATRIKFGEEVFFTSALLAVLSSYLLSFSLVGIFLSWVPSPEMWWPSKLLDVVFFRTWHKKLDDGSRWGMTNKKFFTIVFFVAILFHIPGFFYPSVATISFLCWLWPRSIIAQQLGSGINGLGVLSFSSGWPSVSDFIGDPLATPRHVIYNVMAGFLLVFYVMIPIINWSNSFETKRFPIFSRELFDVYGERYNLTRVLNQDGVSLNEKAYADYSPIHFTAFAIASCCVMFSAVVSSFFHVVVNYGRSIWQVVHQDEHNKMMEKYPPIQRMWFFIVAATAFLFASISCGLGLGPNIRFPLPLLFAAWAISMLIIVPIGIFAAITNQGLPLYLVVRLVGGFLCDNKPIQYMMFTDYSYQSALNAVSFLGVLKLGHYMKINPRSTSIVLVAASIISSSVGFVVTWSHVTPCKPGGCPTLDTVYNNAITWGVIGSQRIFGDGNYATLILSFVVVFTVADLLVSMASRKWSFIEKIKVPVILNATNGMPPAGPANLISWCLIGLIFPVVVDHYVPNWSPNDQYLVSLALMAGAGVLSLLGYVLGIFVPGWGSVFHDQCPCAKCPTAPGVCRVDGCL